MQEPGFTPALGRSGLTGAYDVAIRLLTRENAWRSALLRRVAPASGETILDVGCGTGTFALMLKRAAPDARIIGLDPDPAVLAMAAAKAHRAGLEIEWKQGFARDAAGFAAGLDKAVSSLVFHQVPMPEKRAGVAAMLASVRAGGKAYIADYARQAGPLMRALFRLTVQRLDGIADTQPNADGALERIIAEALGAPVEPAFVIPTATGAISLFELGR